MNIKAHDINVIFFFNTYMCLYISFNVIYKIKPKGSYQIRMAKRYIDNDQWILWKLYKHRNINNIIKITNVKSRFKSCKKYTMLLKFDEEKTLDTVKYLCSCKAGNRSCNPCAHVTSFIILMKIVYDKINNQQPIHTNNNYNMNIQQYIMDCQQYKEWAKYNEVYCVCNEKYDDTFMVQCDSCKEWYHPRCIGESDESFNNTDIWNCNYCIDDSKFDTSSDTSNNTDISDEDGKQEME